MMHVDKNANVHVLDVDWISRKIAYVPFNGRIRSKRRSCMQPFFFFFWKKKWVQDMLTSCLMDLKFWMYFPEIRWIWNLDMLSRGPWIWIWTCFPVVWWIEVWTCFLEVRWIGILDVLPKGPKIEFWTCFLEVQWIWNLKFGHVSQRSNGLKFGRASQMFDGLESWMCFPEVCGFEFGRASQKSDGLKFGHTS